MVDRIPSYGVKVWRKSNGGEATVNIDSNQIFSIYAEQVVTQRIGEANIIFDNEPIAVDVKEGDDIEVFLGWTGSSLHKVFEGEVTSVNKRLRDQEHYLEVKCMDWGQILQEHKVNKSYPSDPKSITPVNASTIIIDLIDVIYDSTPGHTERKISRNNVDSTSKTRTIDFLGENIFDSIKKMADVCQFDFYIDETKDLNWFAKNSRTSGMTLTELDLESYNYDKEFAYIANSINCYGAPTKCWPLDRDAKTESVTNWSDDGSSGVVSLYSPAAAGRRAGTACFGLRVDHTAESLVWAHLFCKLNLDEVLDLTKKEAFTELVFTVVTFRSSNDPGGSQFWVELIDSSANRVKYKAGDKNPGWFFGPTSAPGTVPFAEIHVPLGEGHRDVWDLTGETFDWSAITDVAFKSYVYLGSNTTDIIVTYIDWLHFDKGKWLGTYKDTASIATYGLKSKELYDETVFSNAASSRRAKEYCLKYKDLLDIWTDVIVDRIGMESLDPGETVKMKVTEKTMDVRIEEVHHRLDDTLEYTVELILAPDPPIFLSEVKSISDRTRRKEQVFSRSVRPGELVEVD